MGKTKETEVQMESNEQVYEDIKKKVDTGAMNKSQAFRELYEAGMTVGQISKFMASHYSFVYGVISGTYGSVNTNKASGPSKSDKIREMAAQGMTPGDIAKALNSNYSYVHSVVKKWKLQNGEVMIEATPEVTEVNETIE